MLRLAAISRNMMRTVHRFDFFRTLKKCSTGDIMRKRNNPPVAIDTLKLFFQCSSLLSQRKVGMASLGLSCRGFFPHRNR